MENYLVTSTVTVTTTYRIKANSPEAARKGLIVEEFGDLDEAVVSTGSNVTIDSVEPEKEPAYV